MRLREKLYLGGVVIAALAISLIIFTPTIPTMDQVLAWLCFTAMTMVAQLFEVRLSESHSYYPHHVFLFAGALLLPPFFMILLVVIPFAFETLNRYAEEIETPRPWYDLLFNIGVYAIAGFTARWMYFALNLQLHSQIQVGQVFAALVAAVSYVFVNHLLLRLADLIVNDAPWRASGDGLRENLLTELILAYLGYVVAALWLINPFMIAPILGMLALIQRTLSIPQLRMEAQTDSKTGLLNARYFNQRFDEELERMKRLNQPLALIMADLDFLRRVNNTYGHLAGDLVLVGVSKIIQHHVHPRGLAGRFGGEEFAILLQSADLDEAYSIAETIRLAIESFPFEVPTSSSPLRMTMSLGIACFPNDGVTPTELTHRADLAVYDAKTNGRNRTAFACNLQCSPLTATNEHGEESAISTNGVLPQPFPIIKANAWRSHQQLLMDRPVEQTSWQASLDLVPGNAILNTVIGVGLLLTLVSFWTIPPTDWWCLGWLVMLAIIAQVLRVKFYLTGWLSLAAAILFAAALLTGMAGAAVTSMAITLTSVWSAGNLAYVQVSAIRKAAYYWAVGTIASVLPAFLMYLLDPSLTFGSLPILLIPFAIAAIAYSYIGTALVAIEVSYATGQKLLTVWSTEFQGFLGQYLVLCVIGLFLSFAYTMLGTTGLLLFALPIYIMRYAQEQYLGRTEAPKEMPLPATMHPPLTKESLQFDQSYVPQ